jgi:hypothetical protein
MSMANGGDAKIKRLQRLFLSPGMGHCSGGSATPRYVRHAFCRSELGGEEHTARFHHSDRPRISWTQQTVVPVSDTRVIQRQRRSGERSELQLPSVKRCERRFTWIALSVLTLAFVVLRLDAQRGGGAVPPVPGAQKRITIASAMLDRPILSIKKREVSDHP